jgi:hypothetical protein
MLRMMWEETARWIRYDVRLTPCAVGLAGALMLALHMLGAFRGWLEHYEMATWTVGAGHRDDLGWVVQVRDAAGYGFDFGLGTLATLEVSVPLLVAAVLYSTVLCQYASEHRAHWRMLREFASPDEFSTTTVARFLLGHRFSLYVDGQLSMMAMNREVMIQRYGSIVAIGGGVAFKAYVWLLIVHHGLIVSLRMMNPFNQSAVSRSWYLLNNGQAVAVIDEFSQYEFGDGVGRENVIYAFAAVGDWHEVCRRIALYQHETFEGYRFGDIVRGDMRKLRQLGNSPDWVDALDSYFAAGGFEPRTTMVPLLPVMMMCVVGMGFALVTY